jgi:hypothetical protein
MLLIVLSRGTMSGMGMPLIMESDGGIEVAILRDRFIVSIAVVSSEIPWLSREIWVDTVKKWHAVSGLNHNEITFYLQLNGGTMGILVVFGIGTLTTIVDVSWRPTLLNSCCVHLKCGWTEITTFDPALHPFCHGTSSVG